MLDESIFYISKGLIATQHPTVDGVPRVSERLPGVRHFFLIGSYRKGIPFSRSSLDKIWAFNFRYIIAVVELFSKLL